MGIFIPCALPLPGGVSMINVRTGSGYGCAICSPGATRTWWPARWRINWRGSPGPSSPKGHITSPVLPFLGFKHPRSGYAASTRSVTHFECSARMAVRGRLESLPKSYVAVYAVTPDVHEVEAEGVNGCERSYKVSGAMSMLPGQTTVP